MDEFDGWVVFDRKGSVTRVYVELFADGAICLDEGDRVKIRRADDDLITITPKGLAMLGEDAE